jgi:hypothetical protein
MVVRRGLGLIRSQASRMKIWLASLCVAASSGCTQTGSLDLQLSLPTDPDLRPTGMTSISVVASSPDIGTQTNTSILDGQSFSAGDLPIATGVQVDVLFHDDLNRLVGVGEAPNLVDIVGNKTTDLAIPVRRPFIYSSSGTKLYTYDPTVDSREASFQSVLSSVTSPQLAISVGGDRLVVASTNQLMIVDTATNMVMGSAISIPGTIKDAVQIPNSHRVAVAHTAGISIVDIDTAVVMTGGGVAVDKVTVGPTTDGHMVAFGLIGRVAPPAGPNDPCTGSSSLISIDVDSPPATATPIALNAAVADIAAAPDSAALFGALPCTGKVSRIDTAGMLTDVSVLSRAAVLTVAGEHVFAAGTNPSVPVCANGNNTVACSAAAQTNCDATSGTSYLYVTTGANLILQSIPLDGSTKATELDVPEPRETMVSLQDDAHQHAQVLRSLAITPLDLVTLPGGQYVSVITANTYFIQALAQGTTVILPCLKTTTNDWMLMDLASSSTASRVRTNCNLTIGTDAGTLFPDWMCEDAPLGETPTQGDYTPISVGALFGAR